MLKSKTKLISLLLASFLVLVPLTVSASGLVPCGGYGSQEKPCTVVDVFVLFARVTNWLLSLVGVFAVFKLIEASFNMITTMGNEEAIKTNRSTMTNAIVGFVFALLAFLFMNTVTNLLLRSKCPVDLTKPLTYLTIKDYDKCQ